MNITVVTAAFNEKHMDRLVESIKRQTLQPTEWIIVNDGSKEISEWLEYHEADVGDLPGITWPIDIAKNRGHFGLYARNIGAMAASHKHIIFLDDDNEWEADHLESLANLEKKTGKVPYCWMHIKGKKDGSEVDRIKKTGFARQGIDLGCILWRKELFEQYGYFRPDAQVTFDWNCIARINFGYGPHNFACTENPSLIFWHKRY